MTPLPPLQQLYETMTQWLMTQNLEQIKVLRESPSTYNPHEPIEQLRTSLQWYETLTDLGADGRAYLFGTKTITLPEIGAFMVQSIGTYGPSPEESERLRRDLATDEDRDPSEIRPAEIEDAWTQECHDDGYAGLDEYEEVIAFWRDLDLNAVLAVILDTVTDDYELDLGGHRCYWMNNRVYPLLFNYVFYGPGVAALPEDIGHEVQESLAFYFPREPLSLPSSIDIQTMYAQVTQTEQRREIERWNYMLRAPIDYYTNHNLFEAEIQSLRALLKPEPWKN